MQYLTLSHCWGASAEIFRLTADTMAEMISGVKESKLPRNFRDAVTVCRKLGKRYIWIDSLCIIQDSKEDWDREAPLMASIYSNSYCTIAAQCAADSSMGFFCDRNPRLLNPCQLPVKMGLLASALSRYSLEFDKKDRPDDKPLYGRAWVLQERLLSPRILKFGASALSWECRQSVAEESALVDKTNLHHRESRMSELSAEEADSKLGISFSLFCSASNLELPSSWDHFIKSWQVLVEAYTATLLSFPTDRMAAFAGIQGIQEQRSGLTYFQGLWVDFFLPTLLWHTNDHGGEREAESLTQQNDGNSCIYKAPLHFNSLSWASIEAAVEFSGALPFWHLGRSRIAEIMKSIDSRAGKIHQDLAEQSFRVIDPKPEPYLSVGSISTKSRYQGKRRLQTYEAQSYCARLVRIIPTDGSSVQLRASAVILEGPTYTFTTRRVDPTVISCWSSPFKKKHQRDEWFLPDMRTLWESSVGTSLDIVCLAITELDVGVESTSLAVYSAGVVLAENLGQPGSYSRVGYFNFWFSSSAEFREARETAVYHQMYIL